jgi:hypothetical protein
MPDLDNEIGRLTYGLRANAADICEIWFRMPSRRADFGERELLDIKEAYLGLGVLLREMDKTKKKEAA